MKLKTILLAAACATVPFAASASDWTGAYVGAIAGYASKHTDFKDPDGDMITEDGGQISFTGNGGLFGAEAGYNWQMQNTVFGLEADGAFGDISGKTYGWDTYYPIQSKWNGLVTVRARAGIAFDNSLVYVTGGVAFADEKHSALYDGPCNSDYSGCSNGWKTGLAVGAGIESWFASDVSWKLEYLYVSMPTDNVGQVNSDESYAFTDSANIVRFGVNWHVN